MCDNVYVYDDIYDDDDDGDPITYVKLACIGPLVRVSLGQGTETEAALLAARLAVVCKQARLSHSAKEGTPGLNCSLFTV